MVKARPTTDIAREALFNILPYEINLEGIDVLDLFAGTGAIGLEFVSRGANEVVSIDIEFQSKRFISDVIRKWEIDNMRIVRADVFKLATKANQSFDLVYADPPYQHKRFMELPDLVLQSGWLKKGGLFILEHGPEHSFEEHPKFSFTRNYGNVNFTFFRP